MKKRARTILIILVIIFLAGWGMGSRYLGSRDLRKQNHESSIITVSTIPAKTADTQEEVVLPANVQAWHEAPIFARTSGYLKQWLTDIGTEVREGDLIAEIETPEIDAQMAQAEADYHTAQANNDLAQITAKRWRDLLKTNSVSRQEADEKIGDARAKEALMASAKANYDRLKQLESFKKITAPFDGVITARNIDNGALINAGSSTTVQELFHIADIHKLRVYVQVPQTYTFSLKPGFIASLHFNEIPDKNFPIVLAKSAGALDPVTRTLTLEFELDNASHAILSGGYGEVHLKIPAGGSKIRLPVNTLLFRAEGLRVATVNRDNKVALKPITIGRDFGSQFEVSSGINVGDSIILNPLDSIAEGQEVHIAAPDKQ